MRAKVNDFNHRRVEGDAEWVVEDFAVIGLSGAVIERDKDFGFHG